MGLTSGGARKGAGRKPLKAKDKRSAAITVRVTKAQAKWLAEQGNVYEILLRAGMPVALGENGD